jgi:hypothetical protein
LHQAEVAQAAVQAVEPHERALPARAAHLFADHVVAIHGGRIAQGAAFPRPGNGAVRCGELLGLAEKRIATKERKEHKEVFCDLCALLWLFLFLLRIGWRALGRGRGEAVPFAPLRSCFPHSPSGNLCNLRNLWMDFR